MGQKAVKVPYNKQKNILHLIVVAGQGCSLFGLTWLEHITLEWSAINSVCTELDQILQKHGAVSVRIGYSQGNSSSFRSGFSSPTQFLQTLDHLICNEPTEKDLDRLVKLGVVEKVKYSDRAAPIVSVFKEDGSVHIYGDYRVTVNPALKVDQYSIPTAEDFLSHWLREKLI